MGHFINILKIIKSAALIFAKSNLVLHVCRDATMPLMLHCIYFIGYFYNIHNVLYIFIIVIVIQQKWKNGTFQVYLSHFINGIFLLS